MERWAGKVAVVTGASVGIGAAIVNKLLDNGLIVVGLARRVEKVKELIDDRPEAKLHAVECDVTNEENVVTAFAWIKENLGSVDVLVNNAGITKETSLSDHQPRPGGNRAHGKLLGIYTRGTYGNANSIADGRCRGSELRSVHAAACFGARHCSSTIG